MTVIDVKLDYQVQFGLRFAWLLRSPAPMLPA